jgi:hypothetical protein
MKDWMSEYICTNNYVQNSNTVEARKITKKAFLFQFIHDTIQMLNLVTLPQVAVEEVGLQMCSCELNKQSWTAG